MDWFEELFGFAENGPGDVRANLEVEGARLRSRANDASWAIGTLETPSLAELRRRMPPPEAPGRRPRVRNIEGDAGALHADPANVGALFQVASQFNLLEMPGPEVTPEAGITGYAGDPTQGPACALAAAPATAYRNYFAEVGGGIGQTASRQIDCLSDVHDALSPDGVRLWTMRNGYALATPAEVARISGLIEKMNEAERDRLGARLRIGLHHDVEATRSGSGCRVTQAFCSALPVAYCEAPAEAWAPFARLVLEAAYEATLLAAAARPARDRSAPVFLTQIGGGVFGNRREWIRDAMERALDRVANFGSALDVRLVHFRQVDPFFAPLESVATRAGDAG